MIIIQECLFTIQEYIFALFRKAKLFEKSQESNHRVLVEKIMVHSYEGIYSAESTCEK